MEWTGRVVLVNPPYATKRNYYLAPPLGLLVVSAALQDVCHSDVSVLDLALEFAEGKLPANRTLGLASAELLASYRADIYGFSVQCFNLPIALDIAEKLALLRPHSKIVFGGHQAKLLGSQLLDRFTFIDHVVSGYIEDELLGASSDSYPWFTPDYSKISDLAHYARLSAQPTGIVEVARGCPYRCTFCSIPVASNHRVMYKPISKVIKEIEFLAENGYQEIHFIGDTFTLNRSYVSEFISALEKHKFNISWTTMTRIDLVSPDILQRMRAVGCHSILYGVESTYNSTIETIEKGGTRYPNLVEFLTWHTEAGISPTFYLLVNLPSDTIEGLEHTMNMASQLSILDPGICRFQLPRFVPGTPLYQDVAQSLAPDPNTPYASILYETLGNDIEAVWKIIMQHSDLCSTYCVAPGPLDNETANVLAWVGSSLFEAFPLTMAILAENRKILELVRNLGLVFSGKEWTSISKNQIVSALSDFVACDANNLCEVFRFEHWRYQLAQHFLPDTSSNYHLSRVDFVGACRAVLDGLSVQSRIFGPQRLYRFSAPIKIPNERR